MAKQKNICAVIQARMGSERLPGKVLIPICGKSVLEHIIERLKFCKLINQTILAIPNTEENDVLEKFALRNSVRYYRGSEYKVLERFYLSAKENRCDVIVRMPADDPLMDPEIIDLTIKRHLSSKADYSCTEYPNWFLPRGLGVEVMNLNALEMVYKNVKKSYEKEDITFHFIKNPDVFKFNSVKLPESLKNPGLRLTLDTKEDLELITKIYENLYKKGEFFKTEEVLNLLNQKPELTEINSFIIQRLR